MSKKPTADLESTITRLVSRVILESTGRSVIPKAEDKLIEKGWLDSLSMVNLVLALQLELQVTLDITDLSEHNFGTVTAITKMVRERSPTG